MGQELRGEGWAIGVGVQGSRVGRSRGDGADFPATGARVATFPQSSFFLGTQGELLGSRFPQAAPYRGCTQQRIICS